MFTGCLLWFEFKDMKKSNEFYIVLPIYPVHIPVFFSNIAQKYSFALNMMSYKKVKR